MFTKREKEMLEDILNFHIDDLADVMMFVEDPDAVEREMEEYLNLIDKVRSLEEKNA